METPMSSVEGKRVLVTGGAGGIGNAVVRLLAERGARVACTHHRSQPELPEGVLAARCNIADREEVHRVFDDLAQQLGGLDALVHAAGAHGSQPADQVTEQDWNHLFDLNGKAAAWTNQAAFRHLQGQDRKSTRLNSSHVANSYAVFCLKKKKRQTNAYS